MARVYLHLVEGADVPYNSLQESLAIHAWRKQQRIELLKTIATVTATVNPTKAHDSLRRLIEEMFPEAAAEREKSIDRALQIMEVEKSKTYAVAPAGHSLKSAPFTRIQNILRQKRGRKS